MSVDRVISEVADLAPMPRTPVLEIRRNSGSHDFQASRMSVVEIDPLQDPRWTAFTDARRDASIFHRREWLEALKTCYGYLPRALSTSPANLPLSNAVVFCEVRSALTGKRFVSLPFSDHCELLVDDSEQLNLFIDCLNDSVIANGWKYFEVRPVGRVPSPQKSLAISNSYYLHRLDLRRSEESLFRSFHRDCVQRKIRRAEREALRYEEGSSELLLNQFYRLMIVTRRRQGLPPQPLKWFRTLIHSWAMTLRFESLSSRTSRSRAF